MQGEMDGGRVHESFTSVQMVNHQLPTLAVFLGNESSMPTG